MGSNACRGGGLKHCIDIGRGFRRPNLYIDKAIFIMVTSIATNGSQSKNMTKE
jgi:hypothetical protein